MDDDLKLILHALISLWDYIESMGKMIFSIIAGVLVMVVIGSLMKDSTDILQIITRELSTFCMAIWIISIPLRYAGLRSWRLKAKLRGQKIEEEE